MASEAKLSHTAALILHAISSGHGYGFSVMEVTGLPSGTVYPALRRLERGSITPPPAMAGLRSFRCTSAIRCWPA
jgi:hypothetical protein